MRRKTLSIRNVDSLRKYLLIFSGVFRLTDSEVDVLAQMVRYTLLGALNRKDGNPFTAKAKKAIAQRMGWDNPYSMNTYIQRLRDKGAITGNSIHPCLIPTGEKQIVFELEWKLNLD